MATRRDGEAFSRYVGEQLRGEAATRGMSVSALARAAGIDRSTLVRYLDGDRAMPLPVLFAAAAAIGVGVEVVIGRAEDRMTQEMEPPATVHEFPARVGRQAGTFVLPEGAVAYTDGPGEDLRAEMESLTDLP